MTTSKVKFAERIYGSKPNRVSLSLTEEGKVRIGLEAAGTGTELTRDSAYKLSRAIVEALNAKE
jgi:hypothetical protein